MCGSNPTILCEIVTVFLEFEMQWHMGHKKQLDRQNPPQKIHARNQNKLAYNIFYPRRARTKLNFGKSPRKIQARQSPHLKPIVGIQHQWLHL